MKGSVSPMRKLARLSPLLLLLVVGACSASVDPSLLAVQSVEIRNYQGEQLSSVLDFHENSIKGVQHVSLDGYHLQVTGLVSTPLELTYDQVLALPHYMRVVTIHCVEGWDATILWEGVRLDDILAQAGVKDGAPVVIFHAVDDYTSSLPLDFIRQNDILLAFRMNGVTLPAERGFPFQVVAESKWGYKWVKWVDRIELSNDTSYKGYWESRGYDNNGDQTGPILEP
jgi:DMSO/TMAO reductase YedYZ molybdopterin-dependent catalytic subunit